MDEAKDTPKRVCIVGLGGGGFHGEAEQVISLISQDTELVLIFSGPDGGILRWLTSHKICASYKVHSPQLIGEGKWRLLYRIPTNFIAAMKIIAEHDVDLVIGVGTIQILPFAFAAKLLGCKAWFYESITRVHEPSMTGKLVARLRAVDRIYYYWPQLKAHFPNGQCVHSETST